MIVVPGLKIEGPLGKGGTAAVAKAYFDELRKYVALKYPLTDSSESTAQFNKLASRESGLIEKIKFPGIVNIYKQSQNPPYLVLELCNGQSLEKIGRVESPDMLLQILCSLAADLEFLRINKIVHCDIKPHNFFLPADFPLYEKGKLFFTKLSDFSLGRLFDEPESARAGHGTVGYTAPETLTQGKTSHKSDLFALGVTAYQLATGKHPFAENESDPVKIESRTQESEPEPLAKMRSDLPAEFIQLINNLLAKSEDLRPESAWRVCETLRACGCEYPFEKALAPHHLLKSKFTYNEFVDSYLELTSSEKEQLRNLTDSKPEYLRMVLTSNYRKEILDYNGEKFEFRTNLYWPAILRRKTFSFFSKSSFSQKKAVVRSAITGAAKSGREHSPGTELIFPFLLSINTVKRFSVKIAKEFVEKEDWHKSAKLFLQAGLLEDAIKSAEKAVIQLKDSESRAEAINLVNRVIEYARYIGKEFDVRQLLMSKGDVERAGGDIDSSMATYNQIIALYAGHPADKLLAETYRDLGDIYKSKQQFQLGIEVLNKALEIYKELKDDLEMSRALNNIGELYRIATDLPNSLKFMRRALTIQKRIHDNPAVANSLNNIAITFGMKGHLNRAISLFSLSLKMKRIVGDQGEIARALNNLGLSYQLSGDFDKSQEYLKESLAINRQIGSKREVFSNLLNLSETMMKYGNLREALSIAKEALELAEVLSLKPHQAHILKTMGNISQRINRFAESEDFYDQSFQLVKEIDDKILKIRLLQCQSELRSEIGDSKKTVLLSEQALQESISLKAKLEEFQSLVILVRTTGKLEHLRMAREIVEELKLNREKLILEFSYLQFLLDIDAKSDLMRLYAPLELQLAKMRDDIEYPRMLNTASEILIAYKYKEKAAKFLSESCQIAKAKSLASEEISAIILAGKIFFEEGNYEKAFASYRTALQLCKQVSMTIKSNEDKISFMKKPKMAFLSSQIRQLNEKIGPKQKAGV